MNDSGANSRRSRWVPSAMVSPNPQHRRPGTPGGRAFHSTEHLAPDAIVAFVDGEMKMNWHMRAARHVAECPGCAAEVAAQESARSSLRQSGEIHIPDSLMGRLNEIPAELSELPTTQFDTGQGQRSSSSEIEPGRPTGLPGEGQSPLEPKGFPVNRAADSKRRRRWR